MYIIYSLVEINNFVGNGIKKDVDYAMLSGFILRIVALTCFLHLFVEYGSNIAHEANKSEILINRLWCAVNQNDIVMSYKIDHLRNLTSDRRVQLTCYQFFNINRSVLLRALSILIYYLFVSLQMRAL